jgi:hypothetical protein
MLAAHQPPLLDIGLIQVNVTSIMAAEGGYAGTQTPFLASS